MDSMNLDAFVYPGWGNPPRLIGDLSQAGNTHLGTQFYSVCMRASEPILVLGLSITLPCPSTRHASVPQNLALYFSRHAGM